MAARLEWDREGNGVVSAVLYVRQRAVLTGVGPDDETVLAVMREQAAHMDANEDHPASVLDALAWAEARP